MELLPLATPVYSIQGLIYYTLKGDLFMKATKLPSGTWRVLAYAGTDRNGRPVRKSFSGLDKRKVLSDAAAWIDEHRAVSSTSCTFGDAAEDFFLLRGPALSPSTLRGYKNVANQLKRKYPRFWRSRVYGISSDDVQALVLQLTRSGLKAKTVKNYTGFISTVLQSKQIRMPVVSLPQKARPTLNVPDIFTVTRTLAAAKDNTELWICIMLAATGPLRRGEVAALEMPDIDFENNVVHVCHDMVMGPDKEWHIKPPKTPTSDRYIIMPEELISAIRKQGYVTNWTPKQIYNKFNWLLKKNDIPHYRFHDLRHFCVSYLKAMGVEDLYIAQRTGHSDYAVLRNVYAHTLQDHQKTVDEKILKDLKRFTA